MSTAVPATNSLLLDPEEQRVIEEQRARRLQRVAVRERVAFLLFTGGFAVAAVTTAVVFHSSRSPSAFAVALMVAAYAAAFRLDFEIGTGSAGPTQLILVPMLFLLPVGYVPLAVAAGILLGTLDHCVRGDLHIQRVLLPVVTAWHSVGPVLVLGVARERGPRLSDWPIYLAALSAQFVVDAASAAGREWVALGVGPSVQIRAMRYSYA